MNYRGFVLADHGCDRAVGERILAGTDHVRSSSNTHDWLGPGAYFWENSPERALFWARFLRHKPESARAVVEEPFVIGAIIEPGNCLDLTDARSLGILKDAYREFSQTMKKANVPLPQNERGHPGDEDLVKRYLDCAVITFLHGSRNEQGAPAFHTVRGAFFEGGPLFPGAGVAEKTHIQWCVRDPRRSVRGYFRPLPGWDD